MVKRGCIQRLHGLVFWQILTALENVVRASLKSRARSHSLEETLLQTVQRQYLTCLDCSSDKNQVATLSIYLSIYQLICSYHPLPIPAKPRLRLRRLFPICQRPFLFLWILLIVLCRK